MGESGPESRYGKGNHTMWHCAGDDVCHEVLLYMWRAPRCQLIGGGGLRRGWGDWWGLSKLGSWRLPSEYW
jgi:hypothetical protein